MTSTVQPAPVTAVDGAKPGRKNRTVEVGRAHWSVKLAVLLICFFWVVPAFGTQITSFRTESEANSSGWWAALNPAKWGGFTVSNYRDSDRQRQPRRRIDQLRGDHRSRR